MNRERIELVIDATKCSGCGACMAACPKAAIVMTESADGSKYPVINEEACIRCGACFQVCEYREVADTNAPRAAYAAAGTCDALVKNSASGGLFATLAQSWVQQGGLVAGAVMELGKDQVQVFHLLGESEEDIRRMQGSKYVHSDAWRCFDAVKGALKAGKNVLFSGTPCQVDAVKRLTGNPDNLITIDLVCHGVPPMKMLSDYVEILSRRFHGTIRQLIFRDKSCGRNYCARIDLNRRKKRRSYYLRSNDLSYYRYFLDAVNFRENCYTCPYAKLERVADLTIGDYWGIEKKHAEEIQKQPESKHWSCLLVNTGKGQRLLEIHGQALRLIPSRAEWIAENNQQLNQPMAKPEKRGELLDLYTGGGYEAVEKAFIAQAGGKLKYYRRLLKNLYKNKKLRTKHEGR